ncbi:hypothetical protein [Sphingomonas mucosissima]|uniref:hypothetical protein n=1 Tax=Sphingomonas mucosissima TaxID=370959 RepID=UPI001124F3F7|nr:hypothetical protein [Sphingomonas mucosissima]
MIFALTALPAVGAYLTGEPWRTIFVLITVLGASVSWWWSRRQDGENRELVAKVEELKARTKVEDASAPGILGQGELATWSYAQLVSRLRLDRFIR